MIALVFDTETTGLVENRLRKLSWQNEVIEFYGCIVNLETGEILDEYETLIKPRTYPMSPETIKITKTVISNDMLFNAPGFTEVADYIKSFIESAPWVIAHNLAFDKEIISIEMERAGKTINWPKGICTIEQTMHLTGFRLSLTNLHAHLFNNETFAGAHRAKVDVQALTRCCVELYRREEI